MSYSADFQTSEIINFYKNKSIFITGATGFLGKVLIEKLLRSCYDLKKIYILVRHKKGNTPIQRLNELFNCKVLFFLILILIDYSQFSYSKPLVSFIRTLEKKLKLLKVTCVNPIWEYRLKIRKNLSTM